MRGYREIFFFSKYTLLLSIQFVWPCGNWFINIWGKILHCLITKQSKVGMLSRCVEQISLWHLKSLHALLRTKKVKCRLCSVYEKRHSFRDKSVWDFFSLFYYFFIEDNLYKQHLNKANRNTYNHYTEDHNKQNPTKINTLKTWMHPMAQHTVTDNAQTLWH